MSQHATEETVADLWAECPEEARQAAERVVGSPANWQLMRRGSHGTAKWHVSGPGTQQVVVKAGTGQAADVVAREITALAYMQAAGITATGYGNDAQGLTGLTSDYTAWLVRPWLTGLTTWSAFQAVRDGHHPDVTDYKRALTAAVDLCTAVGGLHQHGWVHGDLQPHHSVHMANTRTVQLLGCTWAWAPELAPSPAYTGGLVHLLSPELAAAAESPTRPVITSKSADVYALAASLWWSATGDWPLNYRAAAIDPTAHTAAGLRRMIAARRLKISTTSTWPQLTELLREVLTADAVQRPTAFQLAQSLRRLM
ncbi:serine/threonine-protein kinase [Streptomyces celluloflavus]|uniref:hypothetical protein n=1 Tax=Streptomyces celluloflavus TaxID=58344 RepID=UPI0034616F25|nr:hypothetical protein OG717_30280 [Streptomyces celluloflavus]